MNSARRLWTTVLLLGAASPAFAQADPAVPARIDVTEVVVALANLALPVIAGLATYLINRRVQDQQLRMVLGNAVQNAVGIVQMHLGAGGYAGAIGVDHPAVQAGARYIQDNARQAVERFEVGEDRLKEKVVAKLGLVQLARDEIPFPTSARPGFAPAAFAT